MPPTAEATTGFAFQRASVTVRPKPSRSDFWMIIVDALCRAFISMSLSDGISRMCMSGLLPALFLHLSQYLV